MGLKTYEPELKLLNQNPNREAWFVNNENLLKISGTESGYEILNEFKKDLDQNIKAIYAIIEAINNPEEFEETEVDIYNIPIVNQEKFKYILKEKNSKTQKEMIKSNLLNDFFKEDIESIRKYYQYESKKTLKLIYDASDIYDFIRHTSHRVKTNNLAETILKRKEETLKAWQENHFFEIYENVWEKRNATVYMEKKTSVVLKRNEENKFQVIQNHHKFEIEKDFLELINENPHIHAIEIDEDYFFKKRKQLYKMLKEFKEVKSTINQTAYLKIRYLGRHKATGLAYPSLNIVALDVREPSALAHEYFGHHFHLNGGLTREEEISIYQNFERYNNYNGMDLNKIMYYSSVKEVIARATEFTYALYKTNFGELYKRYQNKEITELELKEQLLNSSNGNYISASLKNYSEGSNKQVYFNFQERTPEELLTFYTSFQKSFMFEVQLEKNENEEKTNYLNKIMNRKEKKSIRKKRKILRGIKAYTPKVITEVLEEYKKGNVESLSKEELLANLYSSNDFRHQQYLKLKLNNKEWLEKYNIDAEKVFLNICDNLIDEGLNENTYFTLNLIKSNIPQKLRKYFNIETIGDINIESLSFEEWKQYYVKYKDKKLLLIEPDTKSIEEYNKYLLFFEKLETIGNQKYLVETNILKEGRKAKILENSILEASTIIGNLKQEVYPQIKDNIYIPLGNENKFLEAKEHNINTLNFKKIEEEEIDIKKKSGKKLYTKKENPEFIEKYTYRHRETEIILLDTDKEKAYALEGTPKEVTIEIENNNFYLNGKKEKQIILRETLPEGSYSRNETKRYKILEKELLKSYDNQKIDLKIFNLFEDFTIHLKNADLTEAILKITKLFNTLQSIQPDKILMNNDIKYIIENYDKEIFDALNTYIIYMLMKGQTYKEKVLDNDDKNLFLDFLRMDNDLFKLKYQNIQLFYKKENQIDLNRQKLSKIAIVIKEIEDKLINTIQTYIKARQYENEQEIQEAFETYKKDLKLKRIEILKTYYDNIKEVNLKILEKEIINIFGEMESKEEKRNVQKIILDLENYETEDEEIKNIISLFINKYKKSKANKSKQDLLKDFKTLLNTNISEELDILNNNIFDYSDDNYTRKSKEAIKPAEYKNIYKNYSPKEVEKLYSLIKLYDEEKRISKNGYDRYQNGFTLLEESLEKILQKPSNFNSNSKQRKI